MLFWYIVDTFMARIVSCLTPGFNNYFEKLLVVSACGIATYVRSRRREMRFRKYKMVEVQGIEPWSERVPLGSSPSKLLYTPKVGEDTALILSASLLHLFPYRDENMAVDYLPPKGWRGVRIEFLSTTEGHLSYLFP